jgi:8-oxo-dGTP pyrophosphatase MutT (NUDIX family)
MELSTSPLPATLTRVQNRLQQLAVEQPAANQSARASMRPSPVSGQRVSWPTPQSDPRNAAVLFLLYPAQVDDPGLHLVFIQRPEYEGIHGGQISLPGGRSEGDETLAETALREAQEEVGIDPQRVILLGQLAEFYVQASNHNVHPFVGYCDHRPAFVPCQQEVAEIIEAPVAALLNPASRQREVRDLQRWGATEVPYFAVGEHKIWGATAVMLAEFIHLLGDALEQ